MGRVRLEVLAWATRAFDTNSARPLVLEEEIEEGERVEDFFVRLASRYPGFGPIVFDPIARRLTGQVTIIYNGRLLELVEGLDTELRDGDTLLLVPAFAGGARKRACGSPPSHRPEEAHFVAFTKHVVVSLYLAVHRD